MNNPPPTQVPVLPARRAAGINPALLDVMCTLVFLFLLTSLLAETARKEANERQLPPIALPEMAAPAGTPGEAAPRPVITIGTGPSYFLNDAPAALSDITTELARTPGAEVEIRGDQGVEYGLVITVVDACRQAGAANFVLTYQSSNKQQ